MARAVEAAELDRDRVLFWLDVMACGMDDESILRTFVSRAVLGGQDGGNGLRIAFTFDSPFEVGPRSRSLPGGGGGRVLATVRQVQRITMSVDKGVVLGLNAIETKILGIIPPEKLSSGTKTLLLLLFDAENVYNATNCGDNCAYWILRISKRHDITINLHHLMNFGNGKFTARIGNTGELVHSMDELVLVGADCLRSGLR